MMRRYRWACLLSLISLTGLSFSDPALAEIVNTRLRKVCIQKNGKYEIASQSEINSHLRIKRDGRLIRAYPEMPLRNGDEVKVIGDVEVRIQYQGDEVLLRKDSHIRLEMDRDAHDIYSYMGEIFTFFKGLKGALSVRGDNFYAGPDHTRFYVKVRPRIAAPEVIVESGRVRLMVDGALDRPVALNTYDAFLNGKIHRAGESLSGVDAGYGRYRSSLGRPGLAGVSLPRVDPHAAAADPMVSQRLAEIRQWVDALMGPTDGIVAPADAPRSLPPQALGVPASADAQRSGLVTKYLPLKEFGIGARGSFSHAESDIGKSIGGRIASAVKARYAIGFEESRKGDAVRIVYRGGGWVDVENERTGESARIQITENVPDGG